MYMYGPYIWFMFYKVGVSFLSLQIQIISFFLNIWFPSFFSVVHTLWHVRMSFVPWILVSGVYLLHAYCLDMKKKIALFFQNERSNHSILMFGKWKCVDNLCINMTYNYTCRPVKYIHIYFLRRNTSNTSSYSLTSFKTWKKISPVFVYSFQILISSLGSWCLD